MELYDSEEDQVLAIKDWWRENGKAVILGGVIGLGGLFGWRFYQDSVIEAKEAASDGYSQVIEKLATQGVAASSQVESFIESNKGTEYSVLAALQLAKSQVDAGELDEALAQLEWAKANTQDTAIGPIASFRIARIQAQNEQFDEALSTLNALDSKAWTGRVAELKGDILLRKGDKDAAYSAYTEAQQADDASQDIQFKLDDLAK
ncbi:YfgM family protein [Vibrio algarum]|uniref:Ancillary SecYEG translocon subunit n=1 Tax=Vibrio algarum TaxID=3020714 RepID=A0ABT4YTD5_9VIBR|nr:YfgM family protein [Vibrio sp. KJ40-1]MDB1124735.1 YfgM family protein [Vibrio sp. KJ40-1]